MIKKKFSIFFILALFLIAPSLLATDYFVDATDGNDANTGFSPAQAWRTITEVNSNMGSFSPGDNILFQRGETWASGTLTITCSGSVGGGYITFGDYGSGDKPDFNGSRIISNSSISYVAVEYISVRNTTGTSVVFNNNLKDHITISYVDVADGSTNGIYLDKVDTYIIENCTVSGCPNAGIVIYGSAADKITNGIIRDCDVTGGNDCFSLHKDWEKNDIGENHVVLRCTATGSGEQGFDNSSAFNVLYRDCTVHNQVASIGSWSFGRAQRVYIENCLSYDENDESSVWGIVYDCQYFVVTHSRFYGSPGEVLYMGETSGTWSDAYYAHNTVVDCGAVVYVHEDMDNITLKNNIFDTNSRWFDYRQSGTAVSTNTDSDYNCFYNGNSEHFYDATEGTMDLSDWQTTYNQDLNSQFADPLLTHPAGHDFTLQSGSPAINAGTWLTTITSATGSGTSFTVGDANWFHDGFGLVAGSVIQLEGKSSSVTVTDIDYGTNTITVNESVSWIQGDGVAFAYNGYAPDMGAEESGDEQPPPEEIEKSITITLIIEEKPPPPPEPDFNPVSDPTSQIIEQEQVARYTISIVPIDGFSNPASLSIEGLPINVVATFTPQTIIPSETSILELVVGADAEVGTYDLIVTAKEVIQ